jgi:hypothetical protein
MTVWFARPLPTSQVKCLRPFKEWKKNGMAIVNFAATFAATGHAATAATIDGVSKCHPRVGAARYAKPKR